MVQTTDEQLALERIALSSPALVVDVRNNADSTLLKTVEEDIATLYDEMRMSQLPQWSKLKYIFAYRSYGVLSESDLRNYRKEIGKLLDSPDSASNANGTGAAAAAASQHQPAQPALGGKVHVQGAVPPHTTYRLPQNPRDMRSSTSGVFESRIDQMLKLCRDLRNHRINADNNVKQTRESNPLDPDNGLLRVFFITDALQLASLETAAIYATWLKVMNSYQHGDTYKERVAVIVLCLNHHNRGKAPVSLIQALQLKPGDTTWPHIDRCILMEDYDERDGSIDESAQEEFAQFLLYTLLLAKQEGLSILSPYPDEDAYHARTRPAQAAHEIRLPREKFMTVAQAAYTYSSRWGRKLLNDGLMQSVLQELNDGAILNEVDDTYEVQQWLQEQQQLLTAAMPEQFSRDLPQLQALGQTRKVPELPTWSLQAAEDAEESVTLYAEQLAEAYMDTGTGASLQGVIASLPKVRSYALTRPEDAGTPLIQVLRNARGMLASKRFCKGTRGAIPRAIHQLSALTSEVVLLQNAPPVTDPQEAQQKLDACYAQQKQEFENLKRRFPFFGTRYRPWLQWLTLLIWLFVALICAGIVMDGLTDVLSHSSGLLALLAGGAFGLQVSWLVIVGAIIAVVLTGVICRATVFKPQSSKAPKGQKSKRPVTASSIESRAARNSEIALLIACLVLVLFGGIALLPSSLSFSLGGFTLGLISVLPVAAILAGIVLLVLAITEMVLISSWYKDVQDVHQKAVEALRCTHEDYMASLKRSVVDTMLVQIFLRIKVIDMQGQPGPYMTSIEQAQKKLQEAYETANKGYEMAQAHLRHLDQNHSPDSESSRILFHEELLDIKALTKRSQILEEKLDEIPEFVALPQVIIRAMGEERLEQIEKVLAESPGSATLRVQGNQQMQCNRLLALTVALMLKVTTGAASSPSSEIEWLKVRATRLGCQHERLDEFFHAWDARTHAEKLKTQDAAADIGLLSLVFTAWLQSWWERDEKLKDIFVPDNVLDRLKKYIPTNIMMELNRRTALTANSADMQQFVEDALLAFPSTSKDAKELLLQLKKQYPRMLAFPDKNVVSTLWMMHYVTPLEYFDDKGQPISLSPFGSLLGLSAPQDQPAATTGPQADNTAAPANGVSSSGAPNQTNTGAPNQANTGAPNQANASQNGAVSQQGEDDPKGP